MEVVPFVIGAIVLMIVIRVLAGSMDGGRIRDYVESQGGQVLDLAWSPFGTGWFGSKDERIYEVRYRDGDGNIHAATCKTSLFSGVYFTEDSVVGEAAPTRLESLENENRRLRAELEQHRQLQADRDRTK